MSSRLLGMMASLQVEGQTSPIPVPPWRTHSSPSSAHPVSGEPFIQQILQGRAWQFMLFPSLGTPL